MSWYAMHRGWMDHDAFADEPKTEREAWCWLIENAAYKDTVVGVKGNPVKIKRGQMCHAHRFLAEQWKWPPSKTLRFLKKIAKWSMIRIESEAGQMLLTICEYEKYQNPESASEAQSEAPTDAQSDANKNNKTNKQPVVDHSARMRIGERISKITGWDKDPRWFGDYSLISAWLNAGWDEELDIIPTVERVMKNRDGPPNTLKYFQGAIADAHKARIQPAPEGKHATRTKSQRADDALGKALAALEE